MGGGEGLVDGVPDAGVGLLVLNGDGGLLVHGRVTPSGNTQPQPGFCDGLES